MNRLKQMRQKVGLSGQGLAVKAKISTATVTAIEKWNYLPSQPTQEKIALALACTPGEIWCEPIPGGSE